MPLDLKTGDGHAASSTYFEDNIHAEATSRSTKLGLAQALIIHETGENAQSGRRWRHHLGSARRVR